MQNIFRKSIKRHCIMGNPIKIAKSIKWTNILPVIVFLGLALFVKQLFGFRVTALFLLLVLLGYALWAIRYRIDWLSPATWQVLVILLFIFLGYKFGETIGRGYPYYITVFAMIGLIIYIWLLFRLPEVMLIIGIILITNMFGLYNINKLRVPGFFKMRDLILISFLVPVFIKWVVYKRNLKFLFETPITRAILAFFGLVLFFIILTVLRYNHSFNLSFRIARDYIYYLFFFATLYCVRDKKGLDFVLKTTIILSLICGFMYIIQALSGGSIRFFPGQEVSTGRISGVPLTRAYVSLGFTCTILLAASGIFIFTDIQKQKIISLGCIITVLLVYFFSFGRAGWYAVGVFYIVLLLLTPAKRKKQYVYSLFSIISVFFISILLVSQLRYGSYDVLLRIGKDRAFSGVYETQYNTGTWGARYDAFQRYFDYIIKEHPFIGGGFLYPKTEPTKYFVDYITTTGHSAMVHILSTMGAIGLLSHLLLYIVFAWRGVYILKRINNKVYKGFVAGFTALNIAIWITIFTSSCMVNFDSITIIGFTLGLNEVMYRVDKG